MKKRVTYDRVWVRSTGERKGQTDNIVQQWLAFCPDSRALPVDVCQTNLGQRTVDL